MRTAIYARVSTADQDCSQQLHDLREYVLSRKWSIEGEYVDNGISGTKDSRPAMNRVMEAARRRTIDAIVCVKADRWGRSMPHFVTSVQELRSLGVRFVATSQGIDTDESNPAAKLMMNMLAAFSEFERDLIAERTRAGLQRAKREGRIGGRPKLIVDRKKVLTLSAAGHSTREIGERLGISAASVSRIVRKVAQ